MTANEIRYEAESLAFWLNERGLKPQEAVAVFALVLKGTVRAHPMTEDDKVRINGIRKRRFGGAEM
jgi:hypothetical protein